MLHEYEKSVTKVRGDSVKTNTKETSFFFVVVVFYRIIHASVFIIYFFASTIFLEVPQNYFDLSKRAINN